MKNTEFEVKVNLNDAAIENKVNNIADRAQMKLDAQVLKDSNYYCPMDSGSLQKSGILHTVIGSGWVTWRTPYAAEQYYGRPNKSRQKNPNAAMKWFEVAKARNLAAWLKLIQDIK